MVRVVRVVGVVRVFRVARVVRMVRVARVVNVVRCMLRIKVEGRQALGFRVRARVEDRADV